MRTIISSFFVILLSSFGFTQSVNQLAVDFIYELDSVPEKAFDTYLDQSFKDKVDKDQMVKMWGQIETMFGDFESSSYICTDTSAEYTQVFVNVKFKRKEQDLNISFNDSSKIVGFFMAANIPCQPTIYPLPKYVKEKKFTETNIQFESEGLKMYGALTLPKKVKKGTPIFIFVHGSGPNDRDETIGPNKIFKDLAYGLATKGIPSLRYDKRAYVHKTLALNNDIHKEVLNDVTSAIKWIKTQDNIKDNPIYIIGHSLGAYLAPLIAKNNAEVKGIVMMAGNYRPLEDLIRDQYFYLFGLSEKNSTEVRDEITNMEAKHFYLKNHLTVDSPSEKLPLGMPASYWLSLNAYHQKEVIKNLDIPVFVMQGERDYQVTMKDYELWRETMTGKLNYTAKSYEKLNHLFLEGVGKPNPSEYMTQSNVPDYVLKDIVKWVKTNK